MQKMAKLRNSYADYIVLFTGLAGNGVVSVESELVNYCLFLATLQYFPYRNWRHSVLQDIWLKKLATCSIPR